MPSAAPSFLAAALALALLSACGRSEPPVEPRPVTAGPEPSAAAEQETTPDLESVVERDPAVGTFSFEAYAYDCNGLQITVRPGDDELTVILPDRSITLPQVEAASGARYGDDDIGFWGKGIDSGLLTLDGEDTPCRLNRLETPWVDARARGASFRGIGQEPGWQLEIHPDRIVMSYQYGERRAVTPNPGLSEDPERPVRRWQATTEANELLVEVEDRACTDLMSGAIFPARVIVKLNGRTYTGCGRDLEQAEQ